ncbi:hypothetical protein C2S53_006692 [Perilla frutescens var. hirtella]|uniref:Uncharacterized protein n=1 Tax=Perilla frutescens var. hirtella TaxID=608512 RepID=A0AAD4NYI0_PERFH|nr:hypothetical protein C2S53_006692 [Perilla frutescens var. hirtella]
MSPSATNIILEKKESMQKEKQISVDPISVIQYPVSTGPEMEVVSVPQHQFLPPLPKFMSCSLPNSATSSPRFEFISAKQKKKHRNQQRQVSPLSRQHSVALGNLERLRENRMQRSKSCGEGRACQPSVDFDMWENPNESEVKAERREERVKIKLEKKGEVEEKFKCGACLFLPGMGMGMGKGKTVRAPSQRASLEKFECGSWRSSAVINNEEDGDATSNLFFDLPLELMRCSSVNDAESPVTTGFLFDNNNIHRKGVLKSGSGQLTCNSSRHVRFSTSSPSSPCITPRLRKARDDFSAFLEAQSA